MSHLREIMQKLAETDAKNAAGGKMSAEEGDHAKFQVDAYRADLRKCTEPMLQYEWAWWNEHIEALELCLTRPQMYNEIGGHEHVLKRIEASRGCQRILDEAMQTKMVKPSNHSHHIHPTEHAWELSEENVRREWGIQ